uniref:Uncharacterized protein n=1 Tax=Anguilla anguilla TaxID=7936 RepID=A0A0E9TK11_ANGAN
MAQNKNDKTML